MPEICSTLILSCPQIDYVSLQIFEQTNSYEMSMWFLCVPCPWGSYVCSVQCVHVVVMSALSIETSQLRIGQSLYKSNLPRKWSLETEITAIKAYSQQWITCVAKCWVRIPNNNCWDVTTTYVSLRSLDSEIAVIKNCTLNTVFLKRSMGWT